MPDEKGNISLVNQEIAQLRDGVVEKYAERSGFEKEIILGTLNSVIKNYQPLFNDIDKVVNLVEVIKVKSAKPLLDLFYTTAKLNTTGPAIFRKKFVNSLYLYAFGKTREERLSVSRHTDSFHKVIGFWECHYSKDNSFKAVFETKGKASLTVVALKITAYNSTRCHVEFYQKNSWGKGYVEWFGSNLSFVLKSDVNKEPIYLLMNCGRTLDDKARTHLTKAVGFCVYINESSSPKSVKCVMRSFTDAQVKDYYQISEVDINSKEFREKFKSELILTRENELISRKARLIEFFKKPHLSSDANVFEYTSVD